MLERLPIPLLLLLLIVLAGCKSRSPDYSPAVAPPAIPSLPSEVRQPPTCSPQCSQIWSEQAERWQQMLTPQE